MGGLVQGVGSLLGGGSNNSQFQAKSANILDPTNVDEANQAYTNTQSGINQQQALAQALAGQNGIGNQSSVFNQLQGVANGTGPNPAQAMLNQATGQNIANQAALIAGQRGAGSNVGLLARQAAQQGGALQQNAVGQGATMQANQSLNALGQLGGIAGQQVAQQQAGLQALNSAAQGQQSNLLGGIANQNSSNVSNTSNMNNTNQAQAGVNAKNSANAIGGLTNAAGGALGLTGGSLFGGTGSAGADAGATGAGELAGGGDALGGLGGALMVANKGGEVPNPKVAAIAPANRFPSKVLAPHIDHIARIYHADKFAKGGKVPALVSPGEVYLPPGKAQAVAKDGKNPIKEGEKIPGKAKVKGDSLKNDTVPKKLESGGVVIPRSILESDEPAKNAAKFVTEHLSKSASGDEHGDFKTALKKAILNRKAS